MADKITEEQFLEAVNEAADEESGDSPIFTQEEHDNIKAMREYDTTFAMVGELSMRALSDLRHRARAILAERRKKAGG